MIDDFVPPSRKYIWLCNHKSGKYAGLLSQPSDEVKNVGVIKQTGFKQDTGLLYRRAVSGKTHGKFIKQVWPQPITGAGACLSATGNVLHSRTKTL